MKKRDFETYQKRFRDFEILPKFSETHVFRGTIRHPLSQGFGTKSLRFSFYSSQGFFRVQLCGCICIGNSMICSDIWHKYHE